jgi:hypothetical protein
MSFRKFNSLDELKAKLAEDPTYFTRLAGLENLKRTSPHGLGRSLEAAWTHLQHQQRRARRDVTRNSCDFTRNGRDIRPAKRAGGDTPINNSSDVTPAKRGRDFTLTEHGRSVFPSKNGSDDIKNSRDFTLAKHDPDVTRNSRDFTLAKHDPDMTRNSRDFTLAKHDPDVTRNSRDFTAAKSGSNGGEFYILEQPAVLKKAKVKKQQGNKQLPAAVELPSPLTPPSALFSGLRQARHYIFYYIDQ